MYISRAAKRERKNIKIPFVCMNILARQYIPYHITNTTEWAHKWRSKNHLHPLIPCELRISHALFTSRWWCHNWSCKKKMPLWYSEPWQTKYNRSQGCCSAVRMWISCTLGQMKIPHQYILSYILFIRYLASTFMNTVVLINVLSVDKMLSEM